MALAFVGVWLLSVSVFFILLVACTLLFNFGPLTWKLAFLLWLVGVFSLSFVCFWQYRKRWESNRRFVHRIEQELPDLEQRLITSLEFESRREIPGVSRQLIDGLLADAANRMGHQSLSPFAVFAPTRWMLIAAAVAILAVVGLTQFSSDFSRATHRLTWAWNPAASSTSLPSPTIHVEPGHIAMQRGDDLRITATLSEGSAAQPVLYVQADRLNWRQIPMQPAEGENSGKTKVFVAELPQISTNLVYYVEYPGDERYAGTRSPQYRVSLFDLPRVDGIAITYNFPAYTGLEGRVEDPGGDVLAPEGTEIQVNATLNKSVESAHIVFGDGSRVAMTLQDRKASGRFQVSDDGAYYIELVDQRARKNQNPKEYYIRAIKDRPPTLSLRTPGRDQRVMPLEEVVFQVKADDDYGLTEFQLIYNIIGGEEGRVDFLADAGAGSKSVTGETLLYLEDLGVKPGDILSYSVAVRDNNGLRGPVQVISDIYFLEVTPTDHEFSRGRSGGNRGGGGGGGDSSALVRNQKDVIAATWKLRNGRKQMDEEKFRADSRIVRDAQAEVAQRAQMSISRLTERGSFAEENYDSAVRSLQQAIKAMESALQSLDDLALPEALVAEQQALQSIVQAEAQINKTQVALGSDGGGGGQSGEREDLRELFEMELGQLENRYQLPQQDAADSAGSNEALDRLKELARRQERLTRSQRELAQRQEQLPEEQRRRQLEQLRREQEELRGDLAQLLSQQSSNQRGNSAPSNALQQALKEMEEAANSESPAQAAAKSQKALDALQRQTAQEEANSRRSLAQLQEAVKRRSEKLLQQQRQLQRAVEQESRSRSLSSSRDELESAGASEELLEQRAALRRGVDELARDLRQIASGAGTDQQREAREAHDLARALRPILDKMDTSEHIMQRGMLNLSLRIENDIERELAEVQQRIQSFGGSQQDGSDGEQLAERVRQLRESLESLQEQIARADSSAEAAPGASPGELSSRAEMQQGLRRSRDLARDLTQMAAGGQPWGANVRSIRSELTQKKLGDFLNRPELLTSLLQPLVELERQLHVESELSKIDPKLFSASEQKIPEQYRSLVENYYRMLSERRRSR